MPNDLIIAGLERALIGFRDTTGGFTGVQSTLANAASSGAYVVALPRTASFQAQAPTNLNIDGGDVLYTIIQFGNSKTQPFDLIVSDYDQTLVELISGSVSNATNVQATMMSDNPNRKSPRVMVLGLQSKAVDVNGNPFYVTRWFPSCQMRIKRGGPAYQALSDTVISCTPQMVNKALSGQNLGSTAPGLNMNLTDDKADNYDYVSVHPIHAIGFRQDAVVTTFTAFYRPVSSVVTLNNTPNNFFVGGTPTALTSFSTTTGAAVLAAAGSAAVLDTVFFETDYIPV